MENAETCFFALTRIDEALAHTRSLFFQKPNQQPGEKKKKKKGKGKKKKEKKNKRKEGSGMRQWPHQCESSEEQVSAFLHQDRTVAALRLTIQISQGFGHRMVWPTGS